MESNTTIFDNTQVNVSEDISLKEKVNFLMQEIAKTIEENLKMKSQINSMQNYIELIKSNVESLLCEVDYLWREISPLILSRHLELLLKRLFCLNRHRRLPNYNYFSNKILEKMRNELRGRKIKRYYVTYGRNGYNFSKSFLIRSLNV